MKTVGLVLHHGLIVQILNASREHTCLFFEMKMKMASQTWEREGDEHREQRYNDQNLNKRYPLLISKDRH